MSNTTTRYQALSPDVFPIHHEDTYATWDEAKEALEEWVKRYKEQGYYSSNEGRIDYEYILDECFIVEVEQ